MAERSGGRRRAAALPALGRLLLGHVARFRDARLQDVATRALRDGDERHAWVVTVVNASLRARRVLTRALYLEPRALASRLRFAAPPRDIVHHRLSLLCPTRGRVRLVTSFLDSVHRSVAVSGRVEVLFYVDNDDPDVADYRALFAGAQRRYPRLARCVLRVGDPVGVPAAWNALAAEAGGDALMMANDDQLYIDYGWDVRLDERLAQVQALHPDGVCCLYFDAGRYPDGAADFPIVSRSWYDTLGYFTPTIFAQWEVERWVFDVARRVGRLFAVPGVFVEHRHYQDYKAPFDQTYQRHRMTRTTSFADHALFLRTTSDREDAARALCVVMSPLPHRARECPDDLWFCGYLEENFAKIRAEVDAALGQPDSPLAASQRVDLMRDGRWDDRARAVFPVTAAVVAAIPEATTWGPGSVWLACQPLTPPKGDVLRVCLGIRTGGHASTWEGRCVVVGDDVAGATAWSTPREGSETGVMLVLDVGAAPPPGGADA